MDGTPGISADVLEVLLPHYLKTLKLPTFQREHQKLARLQCRKTGVAQPQSVIC